MCAARTTADAVARLLAPRSVAIVGASDDASKFGGRAIAHLIRHGYEGTIHPINPRRKTVMGLRAFPRVADVPELVDVVVLAVPAARLADSMRDCAAGNVATAIIITSQMAESGAAGEARQAEITAVARDAGVRILGPNCLGVINAHRHLALTPSFTMAVDHLPAGRVSIVSQSGALMTSMFNRGYDCGVGFASCVSLGNQADLELCDFLDHLIDDPDTGALCLYIEGLKDADRFRDCARRAWVAGKPIVAVKVGSSQAGSLAAVSHTASLAGSHAAFEAACASVGITVYDDPEAAVQCADALARWGRIKGNAIAVASGSGGGACIVADRVESGPLRLAQLAPATVDVLAEQLPRENCQAVVDIGAFRQTFDADIIARMLDALLGDPGVGLMLYVMPPQPLMLEVGDIVADLSERRGKPVILTLTVGSVGDKVRARLRQRGFPFHDRIEDALRVATAIIKHGARTVEPEPTRPGDLPPASDLMAGLRPGRLTEVEVKNLLRAAGIACSREKLACTPDDAAALASEIGYPVAVKGVSRALVHKSDAGAVKLAIGDAEAVKSTCREMADTIAQEVPEATLDGFLIAEMVEGVAEVIVGAKWDPQFGPLVLVGYGGIFVEVLRDVQTALAPLSPAAGGALLRELKLWPLLEGVRGRPPADVAALAELIARMSWVITELGEHLVELDLNPVMVRAAGQGAVVVDGRATLAPS